MVCATELKRIQKLLVHTFFNILGGEMKYKRASVTFGIAVVDSKKALG